MRWVEMGWDEKEKEIGGSTYALWSRLSGARHISIWLWTELIFKKILLFHRNDHKTFSSQKRIYYSKRFVSICFATTWICHATRHIQLICALKSGKKLKSLTCCIFYTRYECKHKRNVIFASTAFRVYHFASHICATFTVNIKWMEPKQKNNNNNINNDDSSSMTKPSLLLTYVEKWRKINGLHNVECMHTERRERERKRNPLIRNIWMDFVVYARVNPANDSKPSFNFCHYIRSRNKRSLAYTHTSALVTCMYCAQFDPIDSLTECRSGIGFCVWEFSSHRSCSCSDQTINRVPCISATTHIWSEWRNRSETNEQTNEQMKQMLNTNGKSTMKKNKMCNWAHWEDKQADDRARKRDGFIENVGKKCM